MSGFSIDHEIYRHLQNFQLPDPLGFGKVKAPLMYRADYCDGDWQQGQILPYGPIVLDPFAKVLHYGVEVFEGMKAYRPSGVESALFRPEQNWQRINRSAERLCMPTLTRQQFMEAVCLVTALCEPCIPSAPGQSLYLRPFIIGTGDELSLSASAAYSFYVVASPSDAYYGGEMRVLIERSDCRASIGGTGDVKVGSNYAAALLSSSQTRALGFNESLWLDPENRKNIEELSGMNLFALIDGQLHTPALSGSILPGITRDSIIQLAQHLEIEVVERAMPIDELIAQIQAGDCREVFACGTAAVITPVSVIGEADGTEYPLPDEKPLAALLRKTLVDIQEGRARDIFAWRYPIPERFFPKQETSFTPVANGFPA